MLNEKEIRTQNLYLCSYFFKTHLKKPWSEKPGKVGPGDRDLFSVCSLLYFQFPTLSLLLYFLLYFIFATSEKVFEFSNAVYWKGNKMYPEESLTTSFAGNVITGMRCQKLCICSTHAWWINCFTIIYLIVAKLLDLNCYLH